MLTLITSLLMANAAPNAIPASELAPAIIYTAARHGVNPVLVTQIILVESRGIQSAYNAKTEDHGLMQINEKTRIAYNLSTWCVKQWQCNLNSATRILADMLKMRGGRACMFNVGPRGRLPQYETACLRYESKLVSMN